MLKGVAANRLTGVEREIAKLAGKALNDCWYGGASALVLARRLDRGGVKYPALLIVSDIYTMRGTWHFRWQAWKCPECGQAYLGQEKALQCCQEMLEEYSEE